ENGSFGSAPSSPDCASSSPSPKGSTALTTDPLCGHLGRFFSLHKPLNQRMADHNHYKNGKVEHRSKCQERQNTHSNQREDDEPDCNHLNEEACLQRGY